MLLPERRMQGDRPAVQSTCRDLMKRASGILLHISSLPSPYGIGTLGKAAFEFIDFLSAAGQKYWQMLPIGPTGYADSPYQSLSAFAGNPYFIDPGLLIRDGLLKEDEVNSVSWGDDPAKVDYGRIFKFRPVLFRRVFERIKGIPSLMREIASFENENREWITEYALYMSLKTHFRMQPWTEWKENSICSRAPGSIKYYCGLLEEEILYHVCLQYLFYRQWNDLRAYGEEKGIGFIGDLPFYIPMDTADVWAEPEHFLLDEERRPVLIGGVPPDSFSKTGQLWGTPIYDWQALKEKGYSFWMRRIKAASGLYDVARLDHFRGFESYWGVPCLDKTAEGGCWLPGPGLDLIEKIKLSSGGMKIIAEDLGFLTEEVNRLVEASGFPGMKILQFAFEEEGSIYLPHNYDRNCVVYTGTHDNNTVRGWMEEANEDEVEFAKNYFGIIDETDFNWGFIRGGMGSVADLFVAQMQDYLNMPAAARMNVPGTVGGNWQWRLIDGQLKKALSYRIAEMAMLYGR